MVGWETAICEYGQYAEAYKLPSLPDTDPLLTARPHFWRRTRCQSAGRAKRRFAPARAAAKDDATGPKSLIPIIRFSARPKFSIIQPSASRPVDAAGVRRSEESRVGKGCVSTCRSRWWTRH